MKRRGRRGAPVLPVVVRDLLVNGVLASPVVPTRVRSAALQRLGLGVAAGVTVSPGCFFGGTDVRIGRGTFVNGGVLVDNQAAVTIGTNCAIGHRVQLITSFHEQGPSSRRAGAVRGAPVTIGDGCWIGAGAIVLPGVTVGDGCIIAAGAVVTRDCAPDGVYAGVPARRLRDLAADVA
ncbi:maltose O-acetyltransferase/hypothetical protein [Blastococcus aggregatus]|uniref:Maltose O-acetyltransferase n=1 Tax=Blastococcus aggregatus TaxID=38502 RepID=A0A285V3Q8_9ACTN|nr:DapH/DapD/GlmU-related protein [Blastococcus aggregatus]SOC47141.1 maltose O-acetyltransferase/hypothetical protein [Blastococcus aggregatus]